MQLPYFFAIGNGRDKVSVDNVFNLVFVFNVQLENGVADQFIYNLEATDQERDEVVKGILSRIEAVNYFNQQWSDSKNLYPL